MKKRKDLVIKIPTFSIVQLSWNLDQWSKDNSIGDITFKKRVKSFIKGGAGDGSFSAAAEAYSEEEEIYE